MRTHARVAIGMRNIGGKRETVARFKMECLVAQAKLDLTFDDKTGLFALMGVKVVTCRSTRLVVGDPHRQLAIQVGRQQEILKPHIVSCGNP